MILQTVLLIFLTSQSMSAEPVAPAKPSSQLDLSDVVKEVSAEHHSENDKSELARFQELVKLHPKNANYYFATAEVIMSMGMMNAATYAPENLKASNAWTKRGLDLDPKSDRGWCILGKIALLNQDLKAAKEDYQKAIEANPKSYRTLLLGGNIALEEKKSDDAATAFKAAELAATTPKEKTWAINQLLNAKYDLWVNSHGNEELESEIISDAERMIQVLPEDPWNLHNAALTYRDFGKSAKTIELERKALSKMNFGAAQSVLRNALAAEAITSSQTNHGDFTNANTLINEAASLDKDSSDWYVQTAVALVTLAEAESKKDISKMDKIREQIAHLKKLNPKNALIARVEAGVDRLDRVKSGRKPSSADAQPNPAFPLAQQKVSKSMGNGGQQYWMTNYVQHDNESIVNAAKQCQHNGQLILVTVVEFDQNGRISDWIPAKDSEEDECMHGLLRNVQFPAPPSAPFHMTMSFNLLGYLRNHPGN